MTDPLGRYLDANGNIVARNDPAGHIRPEWVRNMMGSRKVIEFEHKRIIDIQLAEDMGARVVISGGDEHSGIFFSRLRIEHGGKEIWINSEEGIVQKKAPSISDAMILGAEALENGDLLMKLSNEVTLFFPHSDEIESWELRWLNGKQIISLPGGGFAEF